MTYFTRRMCLSAVVFCILIASPKAADITSAERGKHALLTRSFNPPLWTFDSYENAWKTWGPQWKVPPKDYAREFMARYGLHPAPYENGRYPMGLRKAEFLFKRGLAGDCLMCHGGSIAGQSYVGLGNASLDIQALFEDLGRASGGRSTTPFIFSNTRGTSEAGSMAVFLMSYRDPDLRLRLKPLDLGWCDNMCDDVPAWWLLKKKKTMYHTGSADARSVRSLMQFMLSPVNSRKDFEREEPTFADIRAFLLSVRPPKYPFPINAKLAARGQTIFNDTCARCHGTYGAKWTYPNKIVPLEVIGTDSKRLYGLSEKFAEHYLKSWFGLEKGVTYDFPEGKHAGYQAPPLDGVWATAPYLHNGSVPTIYDMLNSKSRPKIFTRSFRTGTEDYDTAKLGWKVTVLEHARGDSAPAIERRKVYDTTEPGHGNGGHTFGDNLSNEERTAVIEYLKTL